MNFPDNLLYAESHEWIRVEGDLAFIGISDFAQSELGDIVYVEVETVDENLSKEEAFGSIEAVKTVTDVLMPVDGEVIEFNEQLKDTPDLINKDPYGDGWLIKIKITDKAQLNDLLKAADYQKHTNH
ncbi:MAG: glycine cleavage system protein GcvH [Bacteroidales bacterium]|nr:glycine cleavage system protein GcvH [Bacteroidales bacterium]